MGNSVRPHAIRKRSGPSGYSFPDAPPPTGQYRAPGQSRRHWPDEPITAQEFPVPPTNPPPRSHSAPHAAPVTATYQPPPRAAVAHARAPPVYAPIDHSWVQERAAKDDSADDGRIARRRPVAVMESQRDAQVISAPARKAVVTDLEVAPAMRTYPLPIMNATSTSAFSPTYSLPITSSWLEPTFSLSPAYRPGLYSGLGTIGALRPSSFGVHNPAYDYEYEYEFPRIRPLSSYPLGVIGGSDWSAPAYTVADVPSARVIHSNLPLASRYDGDLRWRDRVIEGPTYRSAPWNDYGAAWRTRVIASGLEAPTYTLFDRFGPTYSSLSPTYSSLSPTYSSLGYRQVVDKYGLMHDSPAIFPTTSFAGRLVSPSYSSFLDEYSGLDSAHFRPLFEQPSGHRHLRASGLAHNPRCPFCGTGARCPTCAQGLPY